ncbi:MAG: hypothetical protein GYA87_03755 [Christensenellaceae bacterium]|nr:hypothetical protein [Christensenellaceae bacterium]
MKINNFNGDLEDYLLYMLSRVLKHIDEEYDEGEQNDEFYEGKRLAYFEILNMIRNDLDVRGLTFKQLGLDNEKSLKRIPN